MLLHALRAAEVWNPTEYSAWSIALIRAKWPELMVGLIDTIRRNPARDVPHTHAADDARLVCSAARLLGSLACDMYLRPTDESKSVFVSQVVSLLAKMLQSSVGTEESPLEGVGVRRSRRACRARSRR